MTNAGLVVFEGPDGVGKTTLARALVEELRASGRRIDYLNFPLTEKGTLGELVYRIHHSALSVGLTQPIHPTSLQLFHVAAHIDAIARGVQPRLTEGTSVALDRFWWSTWAYGAVGGVPEEILTKMIDVEEAYWGAILPDVVFLVSREPEPANANNALWRWYGRIAERERARYPVYQLRNDRPIPKVLAEVRHELGRLELP